MNEAQRKAYGLLLKIAQELALGGPMKTLAYLAESESKVVATRKVRKAADETVDNLRATALRLRLAADEFELATRGQP